MFEFFEGLIEKLGVKLISDFNTKLFNFIENVKKIVKKIITIVIKTVHK